MTLRLWILAVCAGSNFYLLGVLFVLLRVQYPLFATVPRGDFGAYYATFTPRIALPVVLPEFIAFLTVLPLFASRPASVPIVSVVAAFVAGVAYFAITFAWHLPVHKLLAAGDNSAPVIRALVASHATRTWVHAAKCALILWMLVAGAGAADGTPN